MEEPGWINSFQIPAPTSPASPGGSRGLGFRPGETQATVPSCGPTGAMGHRVSLKGGDRVPLVTSEGVSCAQCRTAIVLRKQQDSEARQTRVGILAPFLRL